MKGWTIAGAVKAGAELDPKEFKRLRKNGYNEKGRREREISDALTKAGISHQRNFMFHQTRMWRFDFFITGYPIALEYEGGTYINGAHTRGEHYTSDCVKYREAVLLGWQLLRYTSDDINRKNKYSKSKGRGGKKVLWKGKGTEGIVADVKILMERYDQSGLPPWNPVVRIKRTEKQIRRVEREKEKKLQKLKQ